MKSRAMLALVALLPAALFVPPAGAATIGMALCTGDGQVHTVRVPVGPEQPPGNEQGPCCAKGCHAGSSRKRGARQI